MPLVYAPLYPLDELNIDFTSEQTAYIGSLLARSPRVVIDETHLHLHLGGLKCITPQGYVVHLYRRARAFATSHLRPTWSRNTTVPRRLLYRHFRYAYNKAVFWRRDDFLSGLRRDEVIGRHPSSKFSLMLAAAGYDAERIMGSPALVRLLAYWHFHYHYLEREGPRVFGLRFRSLRYEEFAVDPERTMRDLYQWIGMSPPSAVTYREVHPPKPPFREHDRRWRTAAASAGFSDEEIETLL